MIAINVPLQASALGGVTYSWKGYWGESFASTELDEEIWLNRLWIRDMMLQRRQIVDIGIASEREERSPFYLAELQETERYPFIIRMKLP